MKLIKTIYDEIIVCNNIRSIRMVLMDDDSYAISIFALGLNDCYYLYKAKDRDKCEKVFEDIIYYLVHDDLMNYVFDIGEYT